MLFLRTLRQAWSNWNSNNAALMASALAYFTLLSAVPLAMALGVVVRTVLGQADRETIAEGLRASLGAESAAVLRPLLQGAELDASAWASFAGVAVILFAGSRLFAVLRKSILQIWGCPEPDSRRAKLLESLRHEGLAILTVVGVTALWFAGLAGALAIHAAEGYFGESVPQGLRLAEWLRLAYSFTLVTAACALVFRTFPKTRPGWKAAWAGAVLTSAVITAAERVMSTIIGRLAILDLFGTASSIMLLLMWFQIIWMLFLFGAEFTRALAEPHIAAKLEERQRRTES